MTRHHGLSSTDCLEISGAPHRLIQSDAAGSIWARLDDDSIHLSFTVTELRQLLDAPETRMKRGHFSEQAAFLRLRCDQNYVDTLPAEKSAKILWQSTWVQCFLDAEARGETSRAEKKAAAFMPELERRVNAAERSGQDIGRSPRAGQGFVTRRAPSLRTLLKWVRAFEKGGGSPIAFLRKRRTGPEPRILAAEAETILAECVAGYLDRNRPRPSNIIENVRNRFGNINTERQETGRSPLKCPSGRTIRRRIKDLDPFEVVAQRKGIDAARRKFGFYEQGIPADYPMQRVEMDEWQIDISTLLGDSGALEGLEPKDRARFAVGRRWIYVAIDCATRCILGFRIVEKPSSCEAIRMLSLITQDKTPIALAAGCQTSWDQSGGIAILVTDQGSAFAASSFRTAVADLGASYEAPPAGVPKLRARIERLFRTFGVKLAPLLIGRTFSNPVERGDYPSEQWAALTDDDLAQIFTLFIVDIYHISKHRGLKGETPANAWKRLSAEQGVTPPPDANHRRAVFGIPLGRKLDRHGVRVLGNNYTSPRLQEALLRGAAGEIPIRLDPADITHISICLGNEWFSAEAVSEVVHGLSLDEWQTIARDLRTRFNAEAAISEDVVRVARNRLRAIDAHARTRQLKRVQPGHLTTAAVNRLESQLFLGLRVGPTGSVATGNLERPDRRLRPGPEALLGEVIQPPEATLPEGRGVEETRPLPPGTKPGGWRYIRD